MSLRSIPGEPFKGAVLRITQDVMLFPRDALDVNFKARISLYDPRRPLVSWSACLPLYHRDRLIPRFYLYAHLSVVLILPATHYDPHPDKKCDQCPDHEQPAAAGG